MAEVNAVGAFEVTVLFGSEANTHYNIEEIVTDEVQSGLHRFEFATEAEAVAFQSGVEQAMGWNDYSFLTIAQGDAIDAADPVDPNDETDDEEEEEEEEEEDAPAMSGSAADLEEIRESCSDLLTGSQEGALQAAIALMSARDGSDAMPDHVNAEVLRDVLGDHPLPPRQREAVQAAIALLLAVPAGATFSPAAENGMPEHITPAELWAAVDGNPGITPTKELALQAARLCAEAVDADEDEKKTASPDSAEYTVWCRQSNGEGTIHITSVPATTPIEAGLEARRECAETWGMGEDAIDVIGVARGDIDVLHWDDEPGGGGVDLTQA